jgi:ATP-dependent DNA helicase RecG
MLDEALSWARRTFESTIVADADGTVRDQPAYPYIAFRELIANALVHRDLDHWSAGQAVEVRLRRDRMVVSNPGGLYGITVERLGKDTVTSARNARLVTICQNARTPDTGARVIEALASGIPTVSAALAEAGLPPAHYVDSGIRFTAVLHQSKPVEARHLTESEVRVLHALAAGPQGVAELQQGLGLSAPNIRKVLRELRTRGLVEQLGGKGRVTIYRTREDR